MTVTLQFDHFIMPINLNTKTVKAKYRNEHDYINTVITTSAAASDDAQVSENEQPHYAIIHDVDIDLKHQKAKPIKFSNGKQRQKTQKPIHTYVNSEQLIDNVTHETTIERTDSSQQIVPFTKESRHKIFKIGFGILAVSWVGLASALLSVVIVMSSLTGKILFSVSV